MLRSRPWSSLLIPLATLGVQACGRQPVEPDSAAAQVQSDLLPETASDASPFHGHWILTSALMGDDEILAGTGLRYVMSFRNDGTYSGSVSNDETQLVCGYAGPSETSCAWDGTYRYSRTVVELDESGGPEPGPDGTSYVLCAGRLMLMERGEDLDGTRLTFRRTGAGR